MTSNKHLIIHRALFLSQKLEFFLLSFCSFTNQQFFIPNILVYKMILWLGFEPLNTAGFFVRSWEPFPIQNCLVHVWQSSRLPVSGLLWPVPALVPTTLFLCLHVGFYFCLLMSEQTPRQCFFYLQIYFLLDLLSGLRSSSSNS